MVLLLDYFFRILPAIVFIGIGFWLIKPNKVARIFFYIFTFILLRDALTPASLWTLGITDGLPWIRLYANHVFLIGMGLCCLTFVVLLLKFDKGNSSEIVFIHTSQAIKGIITSLIALAVLIAPFLFIYSFSAIEQRGGIVPREFLVSIFVFAILGNLLEEILFRGYIYDLVKKKQHDIRAGILSGCIFALFHVYLATTVTSIGLPLLLFTLWEGIICGIVGAKYGIIPSTIVHGGAIFLLTSGLI